MATQTDSTETSVSDFVASIFDAYGQMEIPVSWYVLGVLVPTVGVFVGSVVVALQAPLPVAVRAMIPLLGLLVVVTGVAYPRLALDRRRIQMENQFHLLVTHMTVLSTTNIDRVEVFRRLAQQDEYGELATEINRIVELVDTWNQSMDDACRKRSKEVPSESLSDFFERLAYTLGAGQQLDDFLLSEQDFIVENYTTLYESSLDNLEVIKDLYLSMVLSMTFALVFAIVLPILTGTNPTLTVAAVLIMFAFVQLGFFVVIREIVPHDPVWYSPEGVWTRTETILVVGVAVGAALSLALGGIMLGSFLGLPVASTLFPAESIPRTLYVAIPMTPLLIPGLLFRHFEQQISARDQEFPSFIRALGSSESAKQSTTSTVLSTLRNKDFGPLTHAIDNLYRRLNMRIDSELAWKYFAADTNSYLIQKFSDMYLVGREMGGEPQQLGELISRNMNSINQLREQRRQEAITLIGLLYGITAAAAFAFFIGLEVVAIISGLSLDLPNSTMNVGQLIHSGVYDIDVIEYLLLLLILFNSLLASVIIRTTDGGHVGNAYIHFVFLTWIACLTGHVTKILVGTLMSV